MSASSSKPKSPRERKLERDRVAGKNKTAGTKTASKKKTSPTEKKKKIITRSAETTAKSRSPRKNNTEFESPKKSAKRPDSRPDARGPKKSSSSRPKTGKPRHEDEVRGESRSDSRGPKRSTSSRPKTGKPRYEDERRPRKHSANNDSESYATKSARNKPKVKAQEVAITETWDSLGVHPNLVKLLVRDGITTPFAIQQATLPESIAGSDLLGRAQTGSGKTLAFGLAMLTRLAHRKAKPRQPLALVLVPTRELAMQVADALTPLSHSVDLDVRLIAGGMPYAKQIDALRRGVPILVSTPGRLSDLVEQGHCDLSSIQMVVLDEADQMCDMGFMPQIVDILDLVPKKGQRLLFSATLDRDVDRLVSRYLNDPVLHETSEVGASVTTMEHHVFIVESSVRNEILARISAREGKTILFVRTQAAADRIANDLAHVGVPVGALHGGKSQNLRTRTINEFREGVTNVLVATDVAARGIHVDGISLVVHVDPPGDPKDYLHRSGRTARAGDEGKVVTLIGPRQQRTVLGMMDRIDVNPQVSRISLNSPQLTEITDAREPSGTPWKLPKSVSQGNSGRRRSGQRPAGKSYGRGAQRKSSYR